MKTVKLKSLIDFPNFRQTFYYDCGASAMHSVMAYYGMDISEKDMIRLVETHGKTGTSFFGLINVAKKVGLKYKCYWSGLTISDLKRYIDKKIPVVLQIQAWPEKREKDLKKSWTDGHFVVAMGYDNKRIYFNDPSTILIAYLTYRELEERWHDIDFYKGSQRKVSNAGIVFFGKKPLFKNKNAMHMDYDAYDSSKIHEDIFKIERYIKIK